jgi:hypothetical protein
LGSRESSGNLPSASLKFGSESVFGFRHNADFGETELGSGRVFEPKVFEVHSNRSDLGEKTSEFSGNIINENDQLREVLGNAVFAGYSSNTRIAVGERLRNRTLCAGSRGIGERTDDSIEVGSVAFEDAHDLVCIRAQDLHPEFGLASGNAGRVSKSLADKADRSVTAIEKPSGKQ